VALAAAGRRDRPLLAALAHRAADPAVASTFRAPALAARAPGRTRPPKS